MSIFSKQPLNVGSYYHTNERGATLIVVLLFLILIMLAGVMAVRQSTTDLKTATADQVNTLLLQAADGANIKIEQTVNVPVSSPSYSAVTDNNGIFGYFLNSSFANNELIYCYNPRQVQWNTASTYIINGTTPQNSTGHCVPTNSSSYISGRNTVLTQVSIIYIPQSSTASSGGFTKAIEGTDINNVNNTVRGSQLANYSFGIRSTSALPSYNDPGNCFEHSSVNSSTSVTTTLSECLANRNVPKKQLYTEVDLENTTTKTGCSAFGVGTGSVLNPAKCTAASATPSI